MTPRNSSNSFNVMARISVCWMMQPARCLCARFLWRFKFLVAECARWSPCNGLWAVKGLPSPSPSPSPGSVVAAAAFTGVSGEPNCASRIPFTRCRICVVIWCTGIKSSDLACPPRRSQPMMNSSIPTAPVSSASSNSKSRVMSKTRKFIAVIRASMRKSWHASSSSSRLSSPDLLVSISQKMSRMAMMCSSLFAISSRMSVSFSRCWACCVVSRMIPVTMFKRAMDTKTMKIVKMTWWAGPAGPRAVTTSPHRMPPNMAWQKTIMERPRELKWVQSSSRPSTSP
mmetsp:Transcript_136730/g.340927  ORF Transcript_136730/g.340927 Transcript_136730/m.340927 type:complete len:285 (+) Transcript_136730:1660-2514(+)